MGIEERPDSPSTVAPGLGGRAIRFCLEQKLIVLLLALLVIGLGVAVAPFDWETGALPRLPIPVDAIPDIGEKQQIVFTEWMGRSPQDVDDQITYPLTTYLLGVPLVKTIRSTSMFGFSSIYMIFEDSADFYWARSRVLEKLSSLPPGVLPDGVRPVLGPDATALGQVFQYTLEGRDPQGRPAGGWDLQELRSVQDWYVRFALLSAEGVGEVASIGGFVKEYQVDVDPDAMRAHGVTIEEVFAAVRSANLDVGAMTIEVNRVDYMIRGLGLVKQVADLESAVVKAVQGAPVYVRNVAHVSLGPRSRRGALDREGAEAVGGIVVVRYGFNPLEAIKNVKQKIEALAPGLPAKAVVDFDLVSREEVRAFARLHGFEADRGAGLDQEGWLAWLGATPRARWPAWITTSRVAIVPFYDRTELIYETLGTLGSALFLQILVTVIVVIVMVFHLRSSVLIGATLPLAVLLSFIAMKLAGVEANIVSLSGIAIAIGSIVDMGIILCENILKHLSEADPLDKRIDVIYRATSEVAGAILTAVATTVVGFLPVFAMAGAEGKLFRPLAFTKTFCLIGSIIVALTILPAAAHILFRGNPRTAPRPRPGRLHSRLLALLAAAGPWVLNIAALALVGLLLTSHWLPLGADKGLWRNLLFSGGLVGGLLLFFRLFQVLYEPLLRFFLGHKLLFLSLPVLIVAAGASIWQGFDRAFGFVPAAAEKVGIGADTVRRTSFWIGAAHAFPGLGKEFMPALDEGSFLFMPATMPHASIGEALDVVQKQDRAIKAIPEVDAVVGKIGRAESALDPAPIGMIETVITYKPEYVIDKSGNRLRFQYDNFREEHVRNEAGDLIPDPGGRPFRQWRPEIRTPDDIWREIVEVAGIPGTTSAPRLQPIAARLVMLQSGMRAPMGVKIKGPDLRAIEEAGLQIERLLKEVPGIVPASVTADRIIGSPYLEIRVDREAAARHGVSVLMAQEVIEMAIGGMRATTTVEGRERYPVRVRYMRERRDSIEDLERVLVPAMSGAQIPLGQVADIRYVRGPEAIKSEDTFLVGYVLFDKQPDLAEVEVVERAQAFLKDMEASGRFLRPPGVEVTFAGTYENQLRARETLSVVLPLALFVIFLILYLQFRSVLTTSLVFVSILVCWAGGFLMLWLYGQPWFLDGTVFGMDMRAIFQVHAINLSVAVWVGFLALFGIASDDGVVMATYLDQSFARLRPGSIRDIREATVIGGLRRIRACLMTTATTLLALLPVLTSTGRGSDIMIPMAIPAFGGMFIEVVTLFVVPVLYCAIQERRFLSSATKAAAKGGPWPETRSVE